MIFLLNRTPTDFMDKYTDETIAKVRFEHY